MSKPIPPAKTRVARPLSAGAAADRILAMRASEAVDLVEAKISLERRFRARRDEREQAILNRCSNSAAAMGMVKAAEDLDEGEDE